MAEAAANAMVDVNPFFVHPNENPGVVLVSALLNGANDHSWSRAMAMSLKSKNKIGFIDGTLPKPPYRSHQIMILPFLLGIDAIRWSYLGSTIPWNLQFFKACCGWRLR